MRWFDPEAVSVRACGWRGHVTYAPDEAADRERLRVDTARGEAWCCLRCRAFVPGPPRDSGPSAEAPHVVRGSALRDRLVMRLLAVERVVKGTIFVLLAVGVLEVRAAGSRLRERFEAELPVVRPLADQLGWNLDDSKVIRWVDAGFALSPTKLAVFAGAAFALATIQYIEAVGLWLGHRWGEYFAVVATSSFLPIEIYELTERVTALRMTLLVVNLTAIVWLIWTKRLFGINNDGGSAGEAV